MHTKDARAHGETEQRLYVLSAWRETPFFTDFVGSIHSVGEGEGGYNEDHEYFGELANI